MTGARYVASCSGGKDSVATVLLAHKFHEPLDEAVYCEVMFDKTTSGEVPEHRDFIYNKLKPFCENELGCKFTILRSDKTYDDVFHHIIVRGPYKGLTRGFVWPGKCAVNRDCKVPVIEKYNSSLSNNTVTYIGIASDEPKRLARLSPPSKVSLLAKYGYTEKDAMELCKEYEMLSPIYNYTKRNGCWFCPNMSCSEQRHLVLNHPELMDILVDWEKEDNLYHKRLTRAETPSELRSRILLEQDRTGFCVAKERINEADPL